MKPLQSNDDEGAVSARRCETFDPVGNGNLPPMPYRDMPEPLPLGRVLGPSVILAGLGVGSGEYIIWPFMTATVGTFFLWAAVLSVTVQYFLNMEIERYTLATGETAVAGFVRFWKPWGALFCLFTILPNMWPGWATSGVTILGFLMGPIDVPLVTIGVLVASGVALTASPIVYQTLERAQFFKVGLTLVFLVIAIVAAISPSAWAELPKAVTGFGRLPDAGAIPIALMLSGLVFAGAGGVNNLCQSNWIRDKGFGMGIYIPRIVSPITGEEVAAPATGSMMRQDPENLRRFRGWWAVANREQLVSFWFICVFSITVFSTLAYSTVFGKAIAGQANLAFIRAEGEALKQVVAPWFGTFFWVFGALSMILVALGTIDYIARIVADVLKTVYLQDSRRWTESRLYFLVAWGTIAAGSIILLSGFNQPLLLLVTAACLNGMVMFVYSILLIQLNRRGLPPAIRVSGFRLAMLVFATLFYGFFAGWLVIEQVRALSGCRIGPVDGSRLSGRGVVGPGVWSCPTPRHPYAPTPLRPLEVRVLDNPDHVAERVLQRRDLDVAADLRDGIGRRGALGHQGGVRRFDVGHAPIGDGVVAKLHTRHVRVQPQLESPHVESHVKGLVEVRRDAKGRRIPRFGAVNVRHVVDDGSQSQKHGGRQAETTMPPKRPAPHTV